MDDVNKAKPTLPLIATLIGAVSGQAQKQKDNELSPVVGYPPRRISGSSQGLNTSPNRLHVSKSPRHPPLPSPELPPASDFDFPRLSPTKYSPKVGRIHNDLLISMSANPDRYGQPTSIYSPLKTDGPPQLYPPIADVP
ncbi:hypothetical protein PV05_09920 [Exophiala xenobiotica]|uniref:Uncharacterized protein n=1 Tax=Exophiala xenobiotica TaxID=348802 RepID=A0A0D2BG32_9EURO|nr:uncharacterized protein PV05_09920 [Exophiala xenobiotica]KIW51176.1 hypothetical protein PV05_09920 [Exophiala xenobiotica]